MMTDYKEMIERMRKWREEQPMLREESEMFDDAANAIEELLESSLNFEELWQQSMGMREELQKGIGELINDREIYKELWFSCLEELKQAQEKCEEMEATLDTEIEYGNELKRKINSLKHNGYYTGTYIKALMEMEE